MANFNLETTLKKALEEYKDRDPHDLAWKTGAEFAGGEFSFKFLNSEVTITHPEGKAFFRQSGDEIGLVERILLLHYMNHAGGTPLAHRNISFKELPGGSIYIEPFTNRCIRPLIHIFGQDLNGFQRAAEACGGTKQTFGEISFCFNALPNVPVTLVLWQGDDEFPASANILFDESAGDYLPTEDYAHLCSMVVGRLKKAK